MSPWLLFSGWKPRQRGSPQIRRRLQHLGIVSPLFLTYVSYYFISFLTYVNNELSQNKGGQDVRLSFTVLQCRCSEPDHGVPDRGPLLEKRRREDIVLRVQAGLVLARAQAEEETRLFQQIPAEVL
jgi:hypothetical protein